MMKNAPNDMKDQNHSLFVSRSYEELLVNP